MLLATETADFLGGFVAGEGCFTVSGNPLSFTFAVGLGSVDVGVCYVLRDVLGVGHVVSSPRRQPHFDDEVCFAVRSLPELIQVVVPFMDEHLPPSYKRMQYEEWRAKLLTYWEHRAKRVRPCTVEGCEQPRRAKGLCRSHYFAVYHR